MVLHGGESESLVQELAFVLCAKAKAAVLDLMMVLIKRNNNDGTFVLSHGNRGYGRQE